MYVLLLSPLVLLRPTTEYDLVENRRLITATQRLANSLLLDKQVTTQRTFRISIDSRPVANVSQSQNAPFFQML